jgi:hypothetical protein
MTEEERIHALLHFQQAQRALHTQVKREREEESEAVDGVQNDGDVQWTKTQPAKRRARAMPTAGDEVIPIDD